MTQLSERVAIVSMAGRFPGAGADLDRFWQLVAAGVDASTDVPAGRWTLPPERCLDPRVAQLPSPPGRGVGGEGSSYDRNHHPRPLSQGERGIAQPDSVYTTRGYYLEPFSPDVVGLTLDSTLVDQLDPLFHLVLDAGNRAWRSARTEKLDRKRVGVVLGNICLPTERSSDLCREVLGGKLGLSAPRTHPLNRYVAGLPAGLLAQGLGLGGGSYTLDAACASSLYALKLACDELLARRADAMLAGGCGRPDCQYTQMGFAQLRALSASGRCSPFDARADGLMVGEGAGIFMLKRLSDALQHGDTILAVIAGVGLSNDMHGNLLAPAREGQLRAMRRAYDRARWQPDDVQMIECHATGTPVGDAVEFESLRELWGESGWAPGQCAIGSVKSTVGHLLTGAGAAAIAKVLLAMKSERLPPQANFSSPAPGLPYEGGPFRVLSRAEPWERRSSLEPRRAAVSGFGFGGVNAHLLLEEWTGIPSRRSRPGRDSDVPKLVANRKSATAEESRTPQANAPVAIVGMAAHFGQWDDLRKFQEHIFGAATEAKPKANGWGLAKQPSPPGHYIDSLNFPTDRFRIPPKELEETLPQQLLMLRVAAAALDDTVSEGKFDREDGSWPEAGAFIGLGLDPNTMNFHLRWSALAAGWTTDEVPIPPLTANRTMGALGSIAASRIARAFHFGGPSHTVCSEEGSAARALELGIRALQSGELGAVLAGGVDLAGDPRMVAPGGIEVPGEGAAAFVLRRLADAERDGDRIYAVIRGVGVAADGAEALGRAQADASADFDRAIHFDAAPNVGATGAASASASLAKACLGLWQEVLPGADGFPSRYWLHDRSDGPRQAMVTSAGADGSHFAILLEEYARNTEPKAVPERLQPLGARDEAVFVLAGNDAPELLVGLEKLRRHAPEISDRNIEAVARGWFRESPPGAGRLAVALVARSSAELGDLLAFAVDSLRTDPARPFPTNVKPAFRDRVFFSPQPLGPKGKVAFVFPGSGNQFSGMGRDLSAQWPEVLRRQESENERLRSQFAPDLIWDGDADAVSPRDLLFGQVTVGALTADVVRSLGVRCDAMVGLSLGESSGLFGVRAWKGRDDMFRRMHKSTLFVSDLAPPYNAARLHWGLPDTETVDWVSGVIATTADDVIAALRPGLRAYLLIVNTPEECVIGGERRDVEKLAESIGKPVTLLTGVTLAHCEAGEPVAAPYRELHTLKVTPPTGVTIYSGAWGKSYKPSDKICAESILAGLLGAIDVPRVIEAAYRDGVRVFIDVGPGNSCVRMVDAILGDRPHLVRAAHAPRQDAVSQILRLIAHLAVERIPVDLAALYGQESRCVAHREPVAASDRNLVIPVGMPYVEGRVGRAEPREGPDATGRVGRAEPREGPDATGRVGRAEPRERPDAAGRAGRVGRAEPRERPDATGRVGRAEPRERPDATGRVGRAEPREQPDEPLAPCIESVVNVQVLTMQAQEAFLRINQQYVQSAASLLQFQATLLDRWVRSGGGSPSLTGVEGPSSEFRVPSSEFSVPRALSYEQCCAYAVGKIGDVLGPRYAAIDSFPTRVRLPDGPLQLVDRITLIEGEPLGMGPGRVVTEHTVQPDRWYLENGRIPTALSVEAGQADLFLSGFLGIDAQTRGLAVYRLLDAVVSFHRGLPRVGETIVYDIRIDEFVKQGDAWLFRFRFDGTVNGEPFITMRNGVAGFFTAEALAAGKGIVQTALDRKPMPGKRPSDWRDLVPQRPGSLTTEQISSLRRGDLVGAFGPEFGAVGLESPSTLPGDMLRLVDRVPQLDPAGGRFGIGFVRAEFDVHPDDWFLTCHFVDDMVMPGTLMYECCLHTLRILLMRMGWVGEAGSTACEPVPGVNSRLKCRGQVIASTRTVAYEVTVKELGYGPEPYAIADALMYADGRPIVEITNMSLRMTGLDRQKLEETWSKPVDDIKPAIYDSTAILAYSNGNPSEAFGKPYEIFDHDRVIARLPGPPFQFLDRITEVSGEPFVMKAGAACEAQYDVPANAWYLTSNRSQVMPFAVLLEIALQPCGWLAAYCGSALTSPVDLSFRNLGGKATQYRPVTADSGTLTATAKMTNVSNSAGMIIQHYDMRVADARGDVYRGTTYFGFFSKTALANQVGIRDAKVPWPTNADSEKAERTSLPHEPPFPGPMLRMVDRITYLPAGGRRGLGMVVGSIAVDPSFWFFQAHFYQDPVWPGSLGLESFLQLLKYAAWKRWGSPRKPWQTVALNASHEWVYRGQVLPTDREVKVLLEVTAADEDNRRVTADGFLSVDGRIIYQMTGFTLE